MIIKTSGTHSAFMAYSGGWSPCWAPHIIDLLVWALEPGLPTMVSSSGGRYVCRDAGDAHDTQETILQYPDFTLTWMMSQINAYRFDLKGRVGIYFHGVNGTLYADYGTYQIAPEGDRMKDAKEPEKSVPDSPGQEREWLDCIRSRKQPSCNVFYHHKVTVPIVLGNLSLKLGRSIVKAVYIDRPAGMEAVVENAEELARRYKQSVEVWRETLEKLPGVAVF